MKYYIYGLITKGKYNLDQIVMLYGRQVCDTTQTLDLIRSFFLKHVEETKGLHCWLRAVGDVRALSV